MGKNSVMNSLGKCIGNVALHKIILEHTIKPESKKHLSYEIWSEFDKEEIKDKAIRRIKNIITNYPDLKYEDEEAIQFIKETMDEIML